MSKLPTPTPEGGLSLYLREIRKFPMLQQTEEYTLAKAWREHGAIDAANKLVSSHLRLVARIAMDYRGYGLPISDLISEGHVGIMQAVARFDPDRGFRLTTYFSSTQPSLDRVTPTPALPQLGAGRTDLP